LSGKIAISGKNPAKMTTPSKIPAFRWYKPIEDNFPQYLFERRNQMASQNGLLTLVKVILVILDTLSSNNNNHPPHNSNRKPWKPLKK